MVENKYIETVKKRIRFPADEGMLRGVRAAMVKTLTYMAEKVRKTNTLKMAYDY